MIRSRLITSFFLLAYVVIGVHASIPHHGHHFENEHHDDEHHAHEYEGHLDHDTHFDHSNHGVNEHGEGWYASLLDLYHDVFHIDLGEGHLDHFLPLQSFYDLKLNSSGSDDFVFYNTVSSITEIYSEVKSGNAFQPFLFFERIFNSSGPLRGPPIV